MADDGAGAKTESPAAALKAPPAVRKGVAAAGATAWANIESKKSHETRSPVVRSLTLATNRVIYPTYA